MRTKLLSAFGLVLYSLCLQAQSQSNTINVSSSGSCACFGITCANLTSNNGDPTVTMTTDPGAWHCWNWGDGTYTNSLGNASATHTYANVGTYTVSVFIQNPAPGGSCAACPNTACSLTDSCSKKIVILTTGISKSADGSSNSFSVNPLQAKGKFNVSLRNLNANQGLEIYNAIGQKVYALALQNLNTEIDLSNLPKGIYFCKVLASGSTDLIQVQKLVLQ